MWRLHSRTYDLMCWKYCSQLTSWTSYGLFLPLGALCCLDVFSTYQRTFSYYLFCLRWVCFSCSGAQSCSLIELSIGLSPLCQLGFLLIFFGALTPLSRDKDQSSVGSAVPYVSSVGLNILLHLHHLLRPFRRMILVVHLLSSSLISYHHGDPLLLRLSPSWCNISSRTNIRHTSIFRNTN